MNNDVHNLVNDYFLNDELFRSNCLNSLIEKNELKLVFKIFSVSDTKEKQFLLKTLDQKDINGSFKAIFLEAMRTNSNDLFQFMAHELNYPKHFFTEAEYNQMVLKALFVDISVSQIRGIKECKNNELTIMVNDYIEERNFANRNLPIGVNEYFKIGEKNENV